MKNQIFSAMVITALLSLGAHGSIIYQEDFESIGAGDTLTNPPWSWGVVNYDSNMVATGGFYFPGGAPNTGIYDVETGQAGPGQGAYTLRSYGDYGYAPNFDNDQFLETVLYAEHTITSSEAALGEASFSFDYKSIDLGGASSGFVFLKVVNSTTFATEAYITAEITTADWSSGNLTTDISAYEGQLLQWGTSVFSQNYSPTGVAVDNLDVQAIPEPATIAFMGIFGGAILFLRRFKLY